MRVRRRPADTRNFMIHGSSHFPPSRRSRRFTLPLVFGLAAVLAVYAGFFYKLSSSPISSSQQSPPSTDQQRLRIRDDTMTTSAAAPDADAANAAAALQPGETPAERCTRLIAAIKDGSLAETGLTRLDLSNCGLTELPPEIGTLSSLEFLNLGKNPLSTLPDTFTGLTNLRILFFLACEFTVVPEILGQMHSLYMLSFKANKVREVPAAALSPKLGWLILSDNQIERLPDTIGKCTGMRKLLLAGNRLTNEGLPDSMVGEYTRSVFDEVNAREMSCRFFFRPLSMCHTDLSRFVYVRLLQPQCVSCLEPTRLYSQVNMNKLELIRLADNRLEKLPEWIVTHPTLAWVALAANPATEPWSEVSPYKCWFVFRHMFDPRFREKKTK